MSEDKKTVALGVGPRQPASSEALVIRHMGPRQPNPQTGPGPRQPSAPPAKPAEPKK